jgi:uncharacterized protein (TIGR02145 family)
MNGINVLSTAIAMVFSLILITCNKNPVAPDNGPITDQDGNIYQTIKIGDQVWMAENLRVTKYNDGTPITYVSGDTAWDTLSESGYCYFNNTTDTSLTHKYGALYNWSAVCSNKLSPKGWHVPTDNDWNTLENYLILNKHNWDGTTTGNKIAKSMASKSDWYTSTNTGAVGNDLALNNKSGFAAFPGGFRSGLGSFYDQGINCTWWSMTSTSGPSSRYLNYGFYYLSKDNLFSKSCGFSIRLVRDN